MELNQEFECADRLFTIIYIDGDYCIAKEVIDDEDEPGEMIVFQSVGDDFEPIDDEIIIQQIVDKLLSRADKAKNYMRNRT